MLDRVDEGEVRPEGGVEFDVREETVERVAASMDMVGVVCFSEELRTEDGGVKLLIHGESGLGIFQIPFWDPRIFFGRVSLPSDQEGARRWSSAVVYDLFNFILFLFVDKVRRWRREVLAVDFIFAIR